MQSLITRAEDVSVTRQELPLHQPVLIRTVTLRFGSASPPYLKRGILPDTYRGKPLVTWNGDAMFGELAVVRTITRDGWDAVWVDTEHDRKFWRAMPHKSLAVALPTHVQARYDAIVSANGGKASGFFDVMAWRDDEFAFIDYSDPDEQPNRNAPRWIEAALAAGAASSDLWYVRNTNAPPY